MGNIKKKSKGLVSLLGTTGIALSLIANPVSAITANDIVKVSKKVVTPKIKKQSHIPNESDYLLGHLDFNGDGKQDLYVINRKKSNSNFVSIDNNSRKKNALSMDYNGNRIKGLKEGKGDISQVSPLEFVRTMYDYLGNAEFDGYTDSIHPTQTLQLLKQTKGEDLAVMLGNSLLQIDPNKYPAETKLDNLYMAMFDIARFKEIQSVIETGDKTKLETTLNNYGYEKSFLNKVWDNIASISNVYNVLTDPDSIEVGTYNRNSARMMGLFDSEDNLVRLNNGLNDNVLKMMYGFAEKVNHKIATGSNDYYQLGGSKK